MSEFGKRKTDGDFIVHVSEEIGRLKEGYDHAAQGFKEVLVQIKDLDEKVDTLRDELHALAFRVGAILLVLSAVGAFIGRYLEKILIK